MAKFAGMLIDHSKATIVLVDGDGSEEMIHLESEVKTPKHKSTGGRGSGRPYIHDTVASTGHADAKRNQAIKKFYKKVADTVKGSGKVVILGVGVAKDEVSNVLAERGFDVVQARLKKVHQRLTDRQVAKHTKEYFGLAAPRRERTKPGKPKTIK